VFAVEREPNICKIGNQWFLMADVERNIAAGIGGVWIDAQPWF
jgi:hypothetical protein